MAKQPVALDLTQHRKVLLQVARRGDREESDSNVEPDPPGPTDYLDITEDLGSSMVEIITADDRIDSCTFTIKHNAWFPIETIQYGDHVLIEGGYTTNNTATGQPSRGVLFGGIVTSYTPVFPDNGKPELHVIASTALYRLTRSRPGAISYPAEAPPDAKLPYKRDFHVGKEKMSIKDIVTGILTEHGVPIYQIKILDKYEKEFTKGSVASQAADESDWDFVCRMLTGRTKRVTSGKDTSSMAYHERPHPDVNAHAKIFMEYNATTKRYEAHVVPEADLAQDKSDIKFFWHSEGAHLVSEASFDPTDPAAEMYVKRLVVTEDPNGARVAEQVMYQDVSSNMASGDMGGSTEVAPDDSDFIPKYSVNQAIKDQYYAKHPEMKNIENTSKLAKILVEEKKWITVTEKVPMNVSANTGPSQAAAIAQVTARIALQPKKKKHGALLRRYGTTARFECRGNIFIVPRRMYHLQLGLSDRYSGLWYCAKVVHKLGDIYSCEVEMGFDKNPVTPALMGATATAVVDESVANQDAIFDFHP